MNYRWIRDARKCDLLITRKKNVGMFVFVLGHGRQSAVNSETRILHLWDQALVIPNIHRAKQKGETSQKSGAEYTKQSKLLIYLPIATKPRSGRFAS